MLQALLSVIIGLALMMILMIGLLSIALVLLAAGVTIVGGLARVVVPGPPRRLPDEPA